jgi:hypothetical protein
MGCSEGLARILVFVANFCFLLVGLALLVVGILFKISYNKFTDGIPDDYGVLEYVPVISIIIGSVIFFISFLGCCGTLKSSTCMLTSYGAILFVIFLVQVALGIFALVTIKNTDDLRTKLDSSLLSLFNRYTSAGGQSSKEAVDLIQKTLECCGTTGRSYWNPNPVPDSCPTDTTAPGCQQALYDFILSSIKLIGIGALTISIVEVVGAVLALCLSNCIRGRERQGAYY